MRGNWLYWTLGYGVPDSVGHWVVENLAVLGTLRCGMTGSQLFMWLQQSDRLGFHRIYAGIYQWPAPSMRQLQQELCLYVG